MLKVESDDYGVLEMRSCGCPLEAYGYTEHLRQIRSFSKFAGEGVTLIGGETIRILEEVLPARFGGGPLDYQLLEEEDDRGFTRLSLVDNPSVAIVRDQDVVECVLAAIKEHAEDEMIPAIWKQAERLRIKRIPPLLTERGKMIPLRRLLHPSRSTATAAV
ncbi:MAG TPA: hypothetical protein VNO43_19350 [Candidatus Eisenbacteria bacterium]|nr:hypothetical protein [Candidatus Eisenbacteria bacterium]